MSFTKHCQMSVTHNHLAKWVFAYELSGCRFESRCSHVNSRYRPCFGQGVPWLSGNYKMWIHSKTRTRHMTRICRQFTEMDLFQLKSITSAIILTVNTKITGFTLASLVNCRLPRWIQMTPEFRQFSLALMLAFILTSRIFRRVRFVLVHLYSFYPALKY